MAEAMGVSVGRVPEKHILLIKLRYIGDTVLISPLLQALKRSMPGSRIDVLVYQNSKEVLVGNPFVHRVWALDQKKAKESLSYSLKIMSRLRRQGYSIVADLTNNDRSSFFTFFTGAPQRIGFTSGRILRTKLFYTTVIDSILGRGHAVDHHLKVAEVLGVPVEDFNPSMEVPLQAVERTDAKLRSLGVGDAQPFVLIYPGARRWYKRWPQFQFARLAERIIHHFHMPVVFCGGEEDVAISRDIRQQMDKDALDVTGKLSLLDFAALVRRAACLIGNDSAPIHLATALNTPTLALFGPTDWKVWGPRRDHDRVIAAEFPCRPCGHSNPECPLGDRYCMSTIELEEVWSAVKETLQERGNEVEIRSSTLVAE
jgi:predicted lipopolysaccharide heptosyltransferase III